MNWTCSTTKPFLKWRRLCHKRIYSAAGCLSYSQVNMKNIRKKMGVTPGEKRYIINELGVGYRMLAEDE